MVYRLRTRIQLPSIMGNGYMEKMHRAILRIKEVHKDCCRAFPCFLFSQEVCVFRKTSQESKAHGISCTSALCPNLPLLKEKKNAKYIHEHTFHLFPYSPLKDPPQYVHAVLKPWRTQFFTGKIQLCSHSTAPGGRHQLCPGLCSQPPRAFSLWDIRLVLKQGLAEGFSSRSQRWQFFTPVPLNVIRQVNPSH